MTKSSSASKKGMKKGMCEMRTISLLLLLSHFVQDGKNNAQQNRGGKKERQKRDE
jgi:hypothetical protein